MSDLAYCRGYVDGWFDDNPSKINEWWVSPNPMFGNISPLTMAENGQEHRIKQYIQTRKMP